MNDFPNYEAAYECIQDRLLIVAGNLLDIPSAVVEVEAGRPILNDNDKREIRATIDAALGTGELLQESYPNPGDGSALSPKEHDEAHEAWYEIGLAKKRGYLVKMWPKEDSDDR